MVLMVPNGLEEFYDYKNQLMDDLLRDEEVLRLLSDDYTPIEDPKSLVLTQVFPFEYIPETVEHGMTFICCDVDIQKSINKTYLMPVLYVWEFTHKSKLILPEGGVRTDKLASEITKRLNGSRYYGLGELDLSSVRRFVPIDAYHGKVLTFNAVDFNRLSPTGMAVPSNRKRG